MIIGCDFDGTIVVQDGRRYDDLVTPLQFMPGARDALYSMRRAGHVLLLWSARAARRLLVDPESDPLVRAGVVQVDRDAWRKSLPVHRGRYRQMLDFVARQLPGVFAAVDDGLGGKPAVDLFIDDKCYCLSGGVGGSWQDLQYVMGAPAQVRMPPLDLGTKIKDLEITQPTGRLAQAMEIVQIEMREKGITLRPEYVVGDGDFWTGNRSVTINLPWFLATDQLWDLFAEREGYTFDSVLRTIRHELGHATNYAYEMFAIHRWEVLFGDFGKSYPSDDFKPDPSRAAEFVQYLDNVPRHYGQKHPDEDWSETFARWLDPAGDWRTEYADKPKALAKLEFVQDRMSNVGPPLLQKRGLSVPYTQLPGTVRQALERVAA